MAAVVPNDAYMFEASSKLSKAYDHFEAARRLFEEFKKKYPELANVQITPQELKLVNYPMAMTGGGLYKRRMNNVNQRVLGGMQVGQQPPPLYQNNLSNLDSGLYARRQARAG